MYLIKIYKIFPNYGMRESGMNIVKPHKALINICIARYPDGTVRLRNPNIELMDQDILYHLALGSGSHDLVEMFGDVKV